MKEGRRGDVIRELELAGNRLARAMMDLVAADQKLLEMIADLQRRVTRLEEW